MTSLSHVVPVIAYLGALQAQGDNAWIDHLDPLIDHLKAVKKVNASKLCQIGVSVRCDQDTGRLIEVNQISGQVESAISLKFYL